MTELPQTLEKALGFNLHRVDLLMRRELMRALADYGMTPEQWQIMAALWEEPGPLNQNRVAAITLKDKHSVSRIIARLERNGWIEKRSDASDARAVSLHLTPKGRALQREAPERLCRAFTRVHQALTPSELDALMAALRKLRRVLEADGP